MTDKTKDRRPVARATITKRTVDALQPGHSLVDDEVRGFVVRRLPSGVASYGLRYSVAGRQKWLGLGLHGRITPSEARDLAKQKTGEVASGRDPVDEREAMRTAAIKCVTLGSVVPIYLRNREHELRASSYGMQARYLQDYWRPLHDLGIGDIQRRTIVATVDTLAEKHGRVAADQARTTLSTLFGWLIDRGYLDSNPALGIKARSEHGSRTRVLTEAELVAVWKACEADDFGRIVQLLILTGQRRTEIGGLAWSEVDTIKRQIDLPEHRTKNGLPHIVSLGHEALEILAGVEHREGCAHLFGEGEGGFSGWSNAKAKLDRRLPKNIATWTLHDLRRSVVTQLVESRALLGTDKKYSFALPHVVEMLVNHVSGHKAGVAGVYNKALYLDERRRALDLWGQHIAALVAGEKSNVIPMLAKSA